MYEPIAPGTPLTQGDIIDNCPIVTLDDANPAGEPIRGEVRVVVLTQACDLAQAKKTRVVVANVSEARVLVEQGVLKPGAIRDQIRRGQTFGWYFLPASSTPFALPESIVDLHDLHTVPRTVLERLIAEAKGVCRLTTPYREHLAQHFGVTYMRIGLPEQYETEP
jgi:hypothetical protein